MSAGTPIVLAEPALVEALAAIDPAALTARCTRRRVGDAGRVVVEVLLALVVLAVCLPVLCLVAAAIFVDTGRPILFRQERVGRYGRVFTLLKFRTMVQDAEVSGPRFADACDERCTRVGRVLRRTRLDEMPQLWNVLHRDMGLIGPRPERPEFACHYAELLPHWELRHQIRPGITGWAQVTVGYTCDVDGTARKLLRDLEYLERRGPVFDARVVVRTFWALVTMAGR